MSGEEIVWNTISQSFDRTRRRTWKEVTDFIDSLSPDFRLLDLGCGNGRHLIPAAKRLKEVVGVDISKELLKIIAERIKEEKLRNIKLVQANATDLPFKESEFDAVIFIAALHNIKEKSNRLKALKEVYRVMKPNAELLISVWSRWQDRFKSYFLKKGICYPFKKIGCYFTRKKAPEFGDIILPWRANNLNIPRFYHLYSKGELQKDAKRAKFKVKSIKSVKLRSKRSADNYFILLKK
jgi:ubiquinone/menaquinone biosynthesis C-methylase UbiE